MSAIIDPFVVLGLDAATATVEEVNASFRRLALASHPDKNPGNQEDAAKEFVKLKNARERAVMRLENPHMVLDEDLNKVATMATDPMVNWAVLWMQRMTYEVAKSQEAKPVEVDLEVSLEDVYHARIKKVVLGVLRADSGDPFKRTRQTVYVRLLPKLSKYGSISLDVIFPAMGDDPPLAILLGFDAWKDMIDDDTLPAKPRSDVIVRVHVKPHETFSIDTVLRGCDLQASVAVSIEGRYLGEEFELHHPSGTAVVVEYDAKRAEKEEKQVHVLKEMGLPFVSDSGSKSHGDLYVFMEPKMPVTLDLDDPRVRDALALLGARKNAFPVVG